MKRLFDREDPANRPMRPAVRWPERATWLARFGLIALWAVLTGLAPQDEQLFQATKDGNLAQVEALLKRGASIHTTTPDGRTPLDLARMQEHVSVVRLLEKATSQQMAKVPDLGRAWKPEASAPPKRREGPDKRPVTSQGTGFVVSRQGHVLTAHHVVAGCRTINASVEGRTLPLTVVATDPTNDAAVLKLSAPLPHTARFRAGRSIQPGESVVVIGFPLAGLLAAQPQVTTGVVSALAGIGNDTRLLQITAPVQPGNSGGPLLDQRGAVVGMVVSKLNAMNLAKLTGDLPQNINFALTGAVLKAFLDAAPEAYEEAASSPPMETVDLAAQARHFTLALECR